MSQRDLHPVAAAGFGSDARRYESGRPGYPRPAVAWLCERIGVTERSTVVDIAAGTGKLTRELVSRAGRVIAVEPVASMGALLTELVPHATLLEGTAEELPLADSSVDAATVAQAFHWFDAERAWAELRRVLRPGAGVGLIWNARDRTVDWIDAVWSIMDRVEKHAPWRSDDRPALAAGDGFTPFQKATFWHDVTVSPDDMVDRVASVSHVAVLPDDERAAVLGDVRAVLPPTDRLSVRYRVDAYATRREDDHREPAAPSLRP